MRIGVQLHAHLMVGMVQCTISCVGVPDEGFLRAFVGMLDANGAGGLWESRAVRTVRLKALAEWLMESVHLSVYHVWHISHGKGGVWNNMQCNVAVIGCLGELETACERMCMTASAVCNEAAVMLNYAALIGCIQCISQKASGACSREVKGQCVNAQHVHRLEISGPR